MTKSLFSLKQGITGFSLYTMVAFLKNVVKIEIAHIEHKIPI